MVFVCESLLSWHFAGGPQFSPFLFSWRRNPRPTVFSAGESSRRAHSNQSCSSMHDAALGETATVAVAIRVRPLSASEHRSGARVAWKHDEQTIWQTSNSGLGGRAFTPCTPYDFDRVYGAQTTTEQIHAESVRHSVARTLQGYHATVLAYGQTSSGKTTTIRGGAGSDGLIPLCVRQVLEAVSAAQRADAEAGGAARQWTLKMSYLEIYNETIGDLLTGQIGLPIFEKRDGAIHVQDLREAPVATWDELERLLLAGDERRHVACTLRNDESSRAHTIFRLSIRSVRGEPDGGVPGAPGGEGYRVTEAELNIVDLAGSERSSPHVTRRAGAHVQRDASGRDVRTTEMSSINKSLLVLGTVVQKLAEAAASGGSGGAGAALHVPYRSSKLTRLLQNSLGGSALCTVVCTLSPASSYCEETHNTLRFAARARAVHNRVVVQEQLDPAAALRKLEEQARPHAPPTAHHPPPAAYRPPPTAHRPPPTAHPCR